MNQSPTVAEITAVAASAPVARPIQPVGPGSSTAAAHSELNAAIGVRIRSAVSVEGSGTRDTNNVEDHRIQNRTCVVVATAVDASAVESIS